MKVKNIIFMMGLLIGLIGLTTNLTAQIDVCNTDATFTATATSTGGASNMDYILVQPDGTTIEASNATGTFSVPADGVYTLYAVNHDGTANIAVVPPTGACLEFVTQTVTVSAATCPPPPAGVSACENESITATATSMMGASTMSYMLVCGGTVESTNTTGTFDLDALGIAPGTCDLYAVNHDGTADLTVAPPTGACLEYVTQTLTVLDAPDLTVNSSLSNACPATTADLTTAVTSTGGGTVSYFMSDGTTPVGDETAVPAGTYVISSTDGTCTETAMVTVTIISCAGPSVCEHEILMVSATVVAGASDLDYVLICGGSVTSSNNTGIFDMDALGVAAGSTCTVYAVNHDGTADLTTVPPSGTCIEMVSQPVIILEGTNALCDTPLPVELLSFTGQAEGKVNKLYWSTASEINSDFFDVERSADGENFSYLGSVEAAGESNEVLDYRFTDEHPKTLSYYRLKVVDLDESYEYSNVVAIKRDLNANSLTISSIRPVPTKNSAIIEFTSIFEGDVNFSVTDVAGRLLAQETIYASEGLNEFTYDFSGYAAAVYIITMNNETSRDVMRIVKN